MPRTNLCKREIPHAALAQLIGGTVYTRKTRTDDVAAMLGCSPNTALKRLRDPGTLTVDELTRLARRLEIPIDALRAAIRY